MTIPTSATFSAAALVAAHTSFRDLLDAGSSAGIVKIRDAAGVLLAAVVMTDPCGTVDGSTGRLTLTMSGPDTSADASGTTAYAEFCDGDGLVHLSLPATSGTESEPGFIVLNTLSIIVGGPVGISSATVG